MKYEPKTLQAKLGWLVEECGEVCAAVGKTLRHGLDSVNPEIPELERETNRDWVLRELRDLDHAIVKVREELSLQCVHVLPHGTEPGEGYTCCTHPKDHEGDHESHSGYAGPQELWVNRFTELGERD